MVVAAVDVEPGVELSYETLTVRSVPEVFVTRGLVRPEEAGDLIGQTATRRLVAGRLVEWGDVASGLSVERGEPRPRATVRF